MNLKENNTTQGGSSQKDNVPGKPYKRFGPNWFYIILLFFLAFIIFSRNFQNTKEISWIFFERTMLGAHDVERIDMTNKEIAEIYSKQDRLTDAKYKDISDKFSALQQKLLIEDYGEDTKN